MLFRSNMMTAKEKVAHRKLSMLQLAEKLRNVSEACKIMGYSRQQFYEIKRSFQEHGFDGLIDKPPIPGSVPTKTPPKLEKKVIDMSIEHLIWSTFSGHLAKSVI